MTRIVINGKFIGHGLNGVHRTAAHYAAALMDRAGPAYDIALLTPRATAPDPDFPSLTPDVRPGLFGAGQGWEMLTLPALARGALLVNFCNLAPVLHGNSVVMIHDAQTFLHPTDYSGRQATAYRALLPLIARRARHILTVSDFAKQSLVAHGIGTPDKISVVHNGTDHILQTPADPDTLSRYGIEPKGYALALGSTKGYKNLSRLFDVFKADAPHGLRLVVAGGPSRDRYVAAGMTPPADAIFTGFVSDGALRALYENAAMFLFPSLTEGFGLPPVEAMHCGCPVIAARAGAMPEVCADAAVLVDAANSDAWRQAVAAVRADPAPWIAKGYARAASLTWDAAGRRLWQVIGPLT